MDVVMVAPLRGRWLEVGMVVEMDEDVDVVVGLCMAGKRWWVVSKL